MAVVEAREIDREYQTDKGVETGKKVFFVRVDDLNDDPQTVHDDASLPAIGDPFKTGSDAKAISKQVTGGGQSSESQLHYQAEIGYSSRKDDQDASIANPLNRPTEYEWGGSNQSEPYFRDQDDKPVTNSAGEQFQTLPEREVNRGTIRVTRNEAGFDDVSMEAFHNTYNSGIVTIDGNTYGAGTLRMRNIGGAGPQEENGVTFYRITYDIKKNDDGWDTEKFEDRGLNEKDGSDLKPITDIDGEPVTMPWPLDGAGAAKANPDDKPAEITRKPYVAKDWSPLSLS